MAILGPKKDTDLSISMGYNMYSCETCGVLVHIKAAHPDLFIDSLWCHVALREEVIPGDIATGNLGAKLKGVVLLQAADDPPAIEAENTSHPPYCQPLACTPLLPLVQRHETNNGMI
ncbi:hypothetical protein TorRG33x02_106210 [Trema orientale]|uniref:Uncharacterized protein n=1 Tax=Trema orientale TaxID=63057 RepID=A0A2P5F779_TREOI|nr:hypothetical protein TorRG33x02_106210 [Trema orientale]